MSCEKWPAYAHNPKVVGLTSAAISGPVRHYLIEYGAAVSVWWFQRVVHGSEYSDASRWLPFFVPFPNFNSGPAGIPLYATLG